jgi:hypothetical protein
VVIGRDVNGRRLPAAPRSTPQQTGGWKAKEVASGQTPVRAGVVAGGLDDLEHRVLIVHAAIARRAEEVALGIGDQTVRNCAIGAIGQRAEADQLSGVLA